MIRILLRLTAVASLATLSATAFASANNHYISGIEGVNAASIAPPGFYYRMYNVFYHAGKSMDRHSKRQQVGFDSKVLAIANRFLWVTDQKLLGADVFMDATLPLVNTNLAIKAAGVDDDRSGLGDINIEPFGLTWRGDGYQAAFGLSVYLPTGSYDRNKPASPGKGYSTFMTTLGGTLMLDEDKTWSASILTRYEVHSRKKHSHFTPGDDFHFEWGVGKTFQNGWNAGIAGYSQWQVTDDKGRDAVNRHVHDRVHAAGPELTIALPASRSSVNLRALKEFGARDRAEGTVATLTFTHMF
ncbi:SphA family protein [Spongorhabdus nitratireducens]